MEEVRIYCSECGFLNTKPGVQNECKACLSQLSLEGTINKVDVILSRFRAWASSKKVKKTIRILEKNETAIQKIIRQIKKKGTRYPFQDDETTDLLKQVLKKDLTPEKLTLEKDLHHTRLTIVSLRQDLENIYAKERAFRSSSSSLSLFKLLEEKEAWLNKLN